MGKAMSLMARPLKRYNIEDRAHKVISRDKPVPAPHYDSTKKQIDAAQTINPGFMEAHNKKDSELDERLKTIYVQSHDPQIAEIEPNPNRVLPTLTRYGPEFEYGFWEPEKTTEGKCSLKTIMTFISNHSDDPIKHSVEVIAAQNKLDPKDVANILEYYRVYEIILQEGDELTTRIEHKKIPALSGKKEDV